MYKNQKLNKALQIETHKTNSNRTFSLKTKLATCQFCKQSFPGTQAISEGPWQNLIVMAGPLRLLSPKIFSPWLFIQSWLLPEVDELSVTRGRGCVNFADG